MKAIWKYIIASVCALMVVAYMVFGLVWSHRTMALPACNQLQIVIADDDVRQYVSQDEIARLIQSYGQDPVGKKRSPNALQEIESIVRKHPMVHSVECYYTMRGDVRVKLTQRIPLVKICTDAESYYVDTDRKKMPVRATITTPVLEVYGNVGFQMASHEVADFVIWLNEHTYWQRRIARVQVLTPSMIHFVQQNDAATIIFGDWNGYEKKLDKLRRWYGAAEDLNLGQYPMVDVRFHGQVIGIKN